MKILAVSDRVLDHLYSSTVKSRYPDVDLIIGCGDLPYYYLEFLISALDAPLVYVLGNHDQGPQYTSDGRVLTTVHGGANIHGQLIQVKGLLLAGLGGSMRYRPYASLMYTENEMRNEFARLVIKLTWAKLRHGRAVDIFVTHSPPYGIHDRPDLAHTGFKIFCNIMRWFKPRYLVHGHIHIYNQNNSRKTQFEETTVINVYPYYSLKYNNSP